MSQHFWIAFFAVHIVVCVVYSLLMLRHVSNLPGHMALILFLIPVFGVVSALCIEQLYWRKKTGEKELALEGLELALGESIFNQYMVEENEDAASIVPLEEALLINDAQTRRSIMLDILHKDPSQYIELLKMARFNHDAEITHYASATIMEAQRDYELELQRCMAAYQNKPEDESVLDQYITALQSYINSELMEGEMLKRQHIKLDDLLGQKLKLNSNNKQTYFDRFDNAIKSEQFSKAREIVELMQDKWATDENVWLKTLQLCVASNDQQQLVKMLEKIKTMRIKWTGRGRARLAFFTEDTQHSHTYSAQLNEEGELI